MKLCELDATCELPEGHAGPCGFFLSKFWELTGENMPTLNRINECEPTEAQRRELALLMLSAQARTLTGHSDKPDEWQVHMAMVAAEAAYAHIRSWALEAYRELLDRLDAVRKRIDREAKSSDFSPAAFGGFLADLDRIVDDERKERDDFQQSLQHWKETARRNALQRDAALAKLEAIREMVQPEGAFAVSKWRVRAVLNPTPHPMPVAAATLHNSWRTDEPKESGEYLVTRRGFLGLFRGVAHWKMKMRYDVETQAWVSGWDRDQVIAWRPLPEPYRPEGET